MSWKEARKYRWIHSISYSKWDNPEENLSHLSCILLKESSGCCLIKCFQVEEVFNEKDQHLSESTLGNFLKVRWVDLMSILSISKNRKRMESL
jgi:hypothetical protein